MLNLIILLFPLIFLNIACSSSHLTKEDNKLIDEGIKSRAGKDDVILKVDKMPEPIGGLATLQENIQYPENARTNNIEGNVIVQCKITKDGKVQDVKVIKGIGYGCDKEAVRVVNSTKFKPGEYNNKKVDVITTIPIVFQL
ncbi:MAG: energy transducer TonB [Melioribacteraceae bacterium]|nr:energy transducer TonB [Saprospiraceae bacterium]MCF8355918.1 energy transducer TonB [Melioribacteraceae bacterium]MCF8395458.1 energy transducer TonB [Melioribacteraceae bacterium]